METTKTTQNNSKIQTHSTLPKKKHLKTNTFTPNTNQISIKKQNLSCINCFQTSAFLKPTDCCSALICKKCEQALNREKCPSCRKYLQTSNLKSTTEKFIMQSYSNCLCCAESDTLEKIIAHIIFNHMQKEEDVLNVIKDDFFLDIFFEKFLTQEAEKKFLFHDHMMKLVPKLNASDCRGGSFYKFPKCEIVKNNCAPVNETINNAKNKINNNNGPVAVAEEIQSDFLLDVFDNNFFSDFDIEIPIKNKKESNFNNINKDNYANNFLNKFYKNAEDKIIFENAKQFFRSFFYYYCESCDYFICNECQNIKKIVYKSKPHQHDLILIKRNTGWGCDARHIGGCKSRGPGYWDSAGKTRFRCSPCDYDLCEKCMEFYMDYQVAIE